jgi:hypothetical protein
MVGPKQPGENIMDTATATATAGDIRDFSQFPAPEWAAVFASDSEGAKNALVPITVEECSLEGLLSQVVQIRIHGKDEATARKMRCCCRTGTCPYEHVVAGLPTALQAGVLIADASGCPQVRPRPTTTRSPSPNWPGGR